MTTRRVLALLGYAAGIAALVDLVRSRGRIVYR